MTGERSDGGLPTAAGGPGASGGTQRDGRPVAAFLDRTDTGLVVVDPTLTVVARNRTADRMDGLEPEPVGMPLSAVHPDFDDGAVAAVAEAARTGEVAGVETTMDGERVDIRAVPTGDELLIELREPAVPAAVRRELRRSERILETLEDGVYTVDEAFVITSINDAITELAGYDREELVGSHASMLAGDETLSMASEIIQQLRDDDSNVGLLRSSVTTADGESLPIETRFSTVEFADGSRERVGLIRDATDQRRHERELRTLNRSARELLEAESRTEVCETIVDVATSICPAATVVGYLLDADSSRLKPAGASGGDPGPRGPGTDAWEAFATGYRVADGDADAPDERPDPPATDPSGDVTDEDVTDGAAEPVGHVIDPDPDGDESGPERTLYASLEGHGLLTVTFPAGEVGSNAAESIELLAANAAAALGRVEREAELSRRGDALEERSRRLERLSEFNDLLRRINAALVDAGTLTAVATAVCNHLADADGVALAWLGETYRGGSLTPVARAGDPDGYLDDVVGDADSPSSAGPAAEPTLRALASGEPVTVADVSGNLRGSPWRERALVRGYQSVASVPLAYNGLEYGVLSVYADRPGAFDGVLGDLLAELGDTIANAINGIEVKRSLRGESLVELDLRVADPDALLVRAAAALDAPVRVDGGVAGGEDRSVVYLESESDPVSLPEAVLAVEEVRSVGDGDDPRAEVTVTDPTLVDRLTDYGASLDTVRADADGLDATVRLPRSADVRGLIEALEERYRAVELRARRERAADADGSGLSTALEERLTDRQREAVRTAYLSGYFEWPRASTGEEVAAALGITQPTFNRHLRTTERTLFSLLFDEGEQTD